VSEAEIDRDLAKLPRPRRIDRDVALVVMAATGLVAAALAWSLSGDARYALSSDEPVDIGAFAEADLAAHRGRYVRATVDLAPARPEGSASSVGFRRPLETDERRLARAADGRWLIYRVPEALAGPRFVPPRLVSGRLLHAQDFGVRFAGLDDALVDAGGRPESAFVLIDDETPRAVSWLLGVEIMMLIFAGWCALSVVQLTRPVRARRH
jgi:hypothetical protein